MSRRGFTLRVAFTLGGLLMFGFGLFLGEAQAVWLKAANICLECIGIG